MRFLMLIHPNIPQSDDAWVPTPEAIASMTRYNQELSEAGVLLALDGLLSPERGVRIRFDGPTPTVKDGPFAEAKEIVGGFWILECASKEEAVAWAKRCPCLAGDLLEVRQIAGEADFPPEVLAAAETARA